jgi:hypothetical protein
MKTTHIAMIIGALLLLRPRTAQVQPLATAPNYLANSSDWYGDQWARLYGADLLPTDAQSSHSPYGLTSCKCTGFNA